MLVLMASPALATDDPDGLTIDSVYAYRHCLEAGDQLYVVEYTIDYSISGNPAENATQTYLVRLMDGTTELGSVAPYAYFDDGYGKGYVALYFSAVDALTKGMISWPDTYTMRLEGNPMLTWSGGAPTVTSTSSFDSWSSSSGVSATRNELTARVLYMADQLEQNWGINMIDTSSAGSYLATYGENYFTNVIPGLQQMAPGAFAGSMLNPDWSKKTYSQDYAQDLADNAVGTPFDLSSIATALGLSTMWLSSILFIVVAGVVIYAICRWSNSTKPALVLSIPFVIIGALLGLIPLIIAIAFGLCALVVTAFALFYHPSGA